MIALSCGLDVVDDTKVELNGTRYNVENWAEAVLSDKKIDMRQLGQTTLILIDTAETENRFRTLFRQINNNIDMTLVASFQEQLAQLEKEDSIPEALESDAALARIRLQEGSQAMAAYELLTNEISNNFYDANKKHDPYEALNGISKAIHAAQRPASSNGAYSYNGDQIKELKTLVVRGKAIAEKYFPEWIPQQRCESVSQLNTYEKHIKKLIETLNKFGYREQARQLKTLSDQEIDNIRIVAERESLRENCNLFLQTSLITKGLTPAALESLQSRAEEFLRVFDGFNYKQVPQLSKLHDSLVKRLQEITEAIAEHHGQITKVNTEIRSLATVADVTAAIQQLGALLEGGLTDDERSTLSKSYNYLRTFMQDIEAISTCGFDPIRLEAVYEALVAAYPADSNINLQAVIESLYTAQSERIRRKAEEWKNQYLSIQPHKMDELALDAWKRSTQPLPAYLDENSRMQHAALLAQVEIVLSERRVSYIVMLYEKLDDNEKRMCRSQMGFE